MHNFGSADSNGHHKAASLFAGANSGTSQGTRRFLNGWPNNGYIISFFAVLFVELSLNR